MRQYDLVIYGSYGYTGKLITDHCKQRGLAVLLSGRNRSKLAEQSALTGYAYEACSMDDDAGLRALLGKAKVVLHCAGPFQYTAKTMVEACLLTRTHYLDITGEYTVFEMLAAYNAHAKDRDIVIMPGVGFDVVPSDCLALHLKKRLPSATHLQLAFTMSKGGMSRGTARTMIEGLGQGSVVRENGKLVPISLGARTLCIDFGGFTRTAMCIPWGDIATAWRSTGIPNIEVYSAVPGSTIRLARLSRFFNWLLRKQWIKQYLRKRVDSRVVGPDEQKLNTGRSFFWGRVWDSEGRSVEARLSTVNGYRLTAEASVLVAMKLTGESVRPGYFTPAEYFGEDFILKVQGSQRT